VYGTPAKGSIVKVRLQDNDVNQANYEASAYLAANANPIFASPSIYGYQDPKGNKLVVNLETGDWTWTHNSGYILAYSSSGVTVTAPSNVTENITGNLQFNVTGNVDINSTGGNVNVAATGAVVITGTTISLN
jgi:hypothetical protein